MALILGIAWAGAQPAPPQASVADDGTVVVVAVVEAPADAVRSALADDAVMAGLFPEVLGERFAPDGDCRTVERKTKGLWRPLVVFARRCPTDRGWREDLVGAPAGGDFSAYRAEWAVVTAADGTTRVEYRVRTELALPVPQASVEEAVRRSALHAMGAFIGRFLP